MYTVSNHEAQHIKQTLLCHELGIMRNILIKTRGTWFFFKEKHNMSKIHTNKNGKKKKKKYFAKIDIQIDEISKLR